MCEPSLKVIWLGPHIQGEKERKDMYIFYFTTYSTYLIFTVILRRTYGKVPLR